MFWTVSGGSGHQGALLSVGTVDVDVDESRVRQKVKTTLIGVEEDLGRYFILCVSL